MPHEPPDPSVLHDVYIDESSQTKNHYLVIGGLIVPTRIVADLDAAIHAARLPQLPFGEMKWGKVSSSKMPAPRRYHPGLVIVPIATSGRVVPAGNPCDQRATRPAFDPNPTSGRQCPNDCNA